jgi:hypothetical protein
MDKVNTNNVLSLISMTVASFELTHFCYMGVILLSLSHVFCHIIRIGVVWITKRLGMQRFGSQIYTPSRKRQVLVLAIYMVIT